MTSTPRILTETTLAVFGDLPGQGAEWEAELDRLTAAVDKAIEAAVMALAQQFPTLAFRQQ